AESAESRRAGGMMVLTNPGAVPGGGPAWWASELTERQRVLLHAQPLFDQRRNDSNQPEDGRHYDSLALSLRVLELVLEGSGLADTVTAAGAYEGLREASVARDWPAGIAPAAGRIAGSLERIFAGVR